MIYIGFSLKKQHIHAVAMAGGFEPVAQFSCNNKHHLKCRSWIENLKMDLTENIIAFVDDCEFTQFKHYHKNVFFDDHLFHKIYLVKHRRLSKWISFLMGYHVYALKSTPRVNKTFILACSLKICSKNDLYLWHPEDDFPF
jgi:hypothetical protein